MSTKIASGFVKFPVLPVAYMAAGPLIGFYRGLRNKNTPLNYGRLVSKYPRDGYVAESWLDWLNGPDDDKPSVFGAMFSTWLGSVTSVIPWLLVVGAVKVIKASRHLFKFLYEAIRTPLFDLPVETTRGIKRYFQ